MSISAPYDVVVVHSFVCCVKMWIKLRHITVIVFVLLGTFISMTHLTQLPSSKLQNSDELHHAPIKRHDFEIIVLTMNRAASLHRLLTSIEKTKYGGDLVKLSIKIDAAIDNQDTIACARAFSFSHGPVAIEIATANRGLRDSWLQAVSPLERGRVIIFEDDVDVSIEWYNWLKGAWDAYEQRTDVAGITLYRQTLVPKLPPKLEEIVNGHQPFMYALVGSIGFSPHPLRWAEFLKWTQSSVDIESFNFYLPNLIFSHWWSANTRRSMWTQLFIYYTSMHDLFTIHVNLPNNKTLASDMREKGVHFPSTFGRDFGLATARDLDMVFPPGVHKYGFDGKLMKKNATIASTLH